MKKKENKHYSEKVTILYGLYNGTRMLIGAINALFLLKTGVSLGGIALIQLVYSVAVFLLEIPTGLVADVISRKLSLILSCLALVVYYPFVYFSAPNMILLGLSQILYALALCLASGAFEGWQVDIIQKEHPNKDTKINYYGHLKNEMNSLITMFSGTFGAMLVYLNKVDSYSFLYNLCAVVMMVIMLGFLMIPSYSSLKNGEKELVRRGVFSDYGKQCASALGSIKEKADSFYYIICIGLLCCSYQVVFFYWQPYFGILANDSKGMNLFDNSVELLVGVVFFFYCLSRYIFNRVVRKRIIEKSNPFLVAIYALCIAAVFMLVMSVINGLHIFVYIVSFAMIQGATLVAESIIEAQYIKVINSKDISSVLSIMSALQSSISMLMLLFVSKTINESNMCYFFMGIVLLYSFIAIGLMKWNNSNKRREVVCESIE